MRRLTAAAVLALAALPVWSSGAAEQKLTSRNSLVASLPVGESIRFDGVGCNVPASATVTLPAGAFDAQVQRPSVGARRHDGRLTGVSVQGNAVTFTAVADVPRVCDPGAETTPPAERPWFAEFDVQGGYKLRTGVVFLDDYAGGFKVRPRQVRIRLLGAARGIRWKSFGGRKAVGFGVFKAFPPCPRGGCTDDGTRLRVELTRPGRCPGESLPGHTEDAVFYGKFAFVLRERLGRLRPGREWISKKLTCSTAGDPPIPIR